VLRNGQPEFSIVNDVVVRIGDMFRDLPKNLSFQEAMDRIQNFIPKKLPEPELETARPLSGLKPGEHGSLEYNKYTIRRVGNSPFTVLDQ
jgi:hypothetical protein